MSFDMYVHKVVDRAVSSYNHSSGSSITGRLIDEIAPVMVCRNIGHKDMPKHFLSRFKNKPWRCPRCETWWETRLYSAAGSSVWIWVCLYPEGIDTDDQS